MLNIKVASEKCIRFSGMYRTMFTGRYRNLPHEHIKDNGKEGKQPNSNSSTFTVRPNEEIDDCGSFQRCCRKLFLSSSDCTIIIITCFGLLIFGVLTPEWIPGSGDGVIIFL